MKLRLHTITYYLFCFLFLYSCKQENKPQATIKREIGPNRDSIKNILQEIKAENKTPKIKAFFNQLYNKRGFNGTVLVAQRGQILYKGAYGWFNKEKKVEHTEDAKFQLASLSKQFTAIAILMLYEEGKLKLEDDVKKYFPKFPYDGINIRMLLNHRSGLPDYRYFCDEAYCCKKEPISNQQVIDLICEHKPGLYYKPNVHFDYNNTNYLLLASIIEKISGKTYANFLAERIFKPLKMTNTFVYDNTDIPEGVALGYSAGWRRVWNDYQNGTVGDKNIYSNLDDLFKWDRALYSEDLLKQETLKLAYLNYSREMKTRNYGFGFRTKCLPNGDEVVFHGGWWRGYNHLFYRRLKDQTAIIVLSNRVNFVFNDLTKVWDILDETCSNDAVVPDEI
jgi:CubicO group peptidase (beta-lactamase class C family)